MRVSTLTRQGRVTQELLGSTYPHTPPHWGFRQVTVARFPCVCEQPLTHAPTGSNEPHWVMTNTDMKVDSGLSGKRKGRD